jgi:hypothetical protein
MYRLTLVGALALGIWLVAGGSASAQQGTGELSGKVVDAQNAVLPGVAVVATNEASGQFREIVSGPDGSFFMSALTPGSYMVTAQLAGFKNTSARARVEVGKTQSVDVARSRRHRVAGQRHGGVAARRYHHQAAGRQHPDAGVERHSSLNRNFTSVSASCPASRRRSPPTVGAD